ncbi:MAG: rhodanese-like domain-containing protein [Chloroflexi bacterium]|nr:rhodanese-like domain-containing protein [Chloroflexota bacterium]
MLQRSGEFSLVLETPAVSPDEASAHFSAKLSVETDISDVMLDLQRGYEGFVLLDARDQAAFDACHIPSAVSMPARRIDAETTRDIPKEKAVVVYCWGPACNSATKAALKLARLGFSVKELIGGIEYWRKEGGHVEVTLAESAPKYWQGPEWPGKA